MNIHRWSYDDERATMPVRRELVVAATAMGRAAQAIPAGPPLDPPGFVFVTSDLHCLAFHLTRLLTFLEREAQHPNEWVHDPRTAAAAERLRHGAANQNAEALVVELIEVLGAAIVNGHHR